MDFRACQRRPGLGHAARALTETHNGAERRGSFPCVEFQYFLHSVCILYRIRAPLRVGVSWANANTGRAPRVCHRAPTAPDAALSVARGETTERTPPGCLCLAPQAWDRGRGGLCPLSLAGTNPSGSWGPRAGLRGGRTRERRVSTQTLGRLPRELGLGLGSKKSSSATFPQPLFFFALKKFSEDG